MKLSVKTISLVILAIVVLGAILWQMDPFTAEESQAAAPADPASQKVYVKAHVIEPELVQDVIASKGTVMPNEEIEVTSEISGKITGIHFKEGDEVREGQLLVSVNDQELQAQLQKEEFQLEFLEKKAAREKKLNEKGGISDEQYESTVRDLNTTQSQITFIKAQLDKTRIKAPFSGTIGLRYVSEGSYLSPAEKIADLVDTDPVKIDFAIPERYMSVITRGSPVSFTVDGMAEAFKGKVYAIEPKIDPGTRTISMRAVSQNSARKLLPGAFANINIVLQEIESALCVPTQSIVPEMDNKKVYIVKNGQVQAVNISTGIRLPSKIEVTEGLNPGDTVLTSGILQVRNGTEVDITEFN